MKTYNVVFNEHQEDGVFAISVVESPAMDSMFIALSKDDKLNVKINLQTTKETEKEKTLIGIALIPDKPVYRNQGGEEFNIVFSKDVIQKAAHNFIKRGYQQNSSIEHETKIDGVSIVESWIVKDPNNDASNAYGLSKDDIVEGAWIVKMKCENQDIYNKAVNGEIKGFSIDGLFSLEEINLKSVINMSEKKKTFMARMSEALDVLLKPSVKVELGSVLMEDGTTEIQFEGETLEPGSEVFVVLTGEGMDPVNQPLDPAEYRLKDGRVLIIEEIGVVASIIPAQEEDMPLEMNEEAVNNMVEKSIKSVLVKYTDNVSKIVSEELEKQKSDITYEFEAKLKAQKEDYENKIIELKNTPITDSKKTVVSQKSYTEMTNREKMIHNRGR